MRATAEICVERAHSIFCTNHHKIDISTVLYKSLIVVVVVVVVFTLKTVLTSIQYLLFLTLQGKETNFRGHRLTQTKVQKNNKIK